MMELAFHELLRIEDLGDDAFVATPPGSGFLYGGLSSALVLRTAMFTVDAGRRPKTFHALFVRGGDWGGPLHLHVDRISDSRAFSNRRVTMTFEDKVVVTAFVSFHVPEEGVEWHEPPAVVAPPETLEGWPARFGAALDLAEVRTVHGVPLDAPATLHPYWAKFHHLADDAAVRDCALAFFSDYMVIHSPFPRHGDEGTRTMSRTLEHAIWFHRPLVDDDWLLWSCEPLSISGGRYVSRGTAHDRQGALIASFTQDGLLRPLPAG